MGASSLTKVIRVNAALGRVDPEFPARLAAVLFQVVLKPDMTLTDVRDTTESGKSAISRLCERLSDRPPRAKYPAPLGLISLPVDKIDWRQKRMRLTPEGDRLLATPSAILEDAEYALHFNVDDVLTDSQRNDAEAQFTLLNTWYAGWSKLPGAVQKYRSDAARQAGLKKIA